MKPISVLRHPAPARAKPLPCKSSGSGGCLPLPTLLVRGAPRWVLHNPRLPVLKPSAATTSSSASDASDPPSVSSLGILPPQSHTPNHAAFLARLERIPDSLAFRLLFQALQFAASLAFVGLYVWSTYSAPTRWSWRYWAEIALCVVFALEYMTRLFGEHADMASKRRMITSFRNIVDLLSWAPPLIEAALAPFLPALPPAFAFLRRLDLRWFKLLRSMRVARIGLLGAELRSLHLSTKKGGWLSAGTNFRLAQLATSVITLLFVATAIFQLLEGMPFHRAFYFTVTTLSTVGSDVVPVSLFGRLAVLGMIAVGIVLIPVQAAAFYAEVSARRVVRGTLPAIRGRPFLLLSARLAEIRAFSDFFAEFRQALAASRTLPRNARLVVLCNRPSFEFTAFQELHERAITLVEGSAVSAQDLVTVNAERAGAIMLMADRFTGDPEAEDLGVLFQVWACKSYTKLAPLFVQTVRQAAVAQVAPFLDPGQDVVISVEAARFRLLALSAVCPGSGTLLGNLLRSSAVRADPSRDLEESLAGRRWFREYVDGCAYNFVRYSPTPSHLAGRKFIDVAEWLFRSSGLVLAGVVGSDGRVRINPAQEGLQEGGELLFVAQDEVAVRNALQGRYTTLGQETVDRLRQVGRADAIQESVTAATRSPPSSAMSEESAMYSTDSNRNNGSVPRPLGVVDAASWNDTIGECVPLIWGSPDSESLDADSVPCVPPDVVQDVRSEAEMRTLAALWSTSDDDDVYLDPGVVTTVTSSASSASLKRASKPTASHGSATAGIERHTVGANAPHDDGHSMVPWLDNTIDTKRSEVKDNERSDDSSLSSTDTKTASLSGHYVICGHTGSIVPFLSYLRAADPNRSHHVVVLALVPPSDFEAANARYGPITFVQGAPSEGTALRAAGAASARALVFLARGFRPVKSAQATGAGLQQERGAREAVLADAAALLTCYGAAEESGAALTHTVVELLFTTSVEFLQPGLLLRGTFQGTPSSPTASSPRGDNITREMHTNNKTFSGSSSVPKPRKSWLLRANMMRAAVEEGLAEWQASPYWAAGRVTVPALLDAYACQCFFSRGLVADVLAELSGELNLPVETRQHKYGQASSDHRSSSANSSRSGALLQQIRVPKALVGQPYGEAFAALALSRGAVCLGLYRRKRESIGSRLSYVATNPRWDEPLQSRDRIFVLMPRPA